MMKYEYMLYDNFNYFHVAKSIELHLKKFNYDVLISVITRYFEKRFSFTVLI